MVTGNRESVSVTHILLKTSLKQEPLTISHDALGSLSSVEMLFSPLGLGCIQLGALLASFTSGASAGLECLGLAGLSLSPSLWPLSLSIMVIV